MYHLNTPHRSASKANGFTLIELVVVVALLAILAAIALPRFLDLTDEAHEVSAENIFSAYEISLREFKGLCDIRGGNATGFSGGMAFPELGVRSSTSGSCYPEAGPPDGRISDQTDCEETFKGMLKPAPAWVSISDTNPQTLLDAGDSAVIAVHYPGGTRRCEFYYVASKEGADSPWIRYNGATGEVERFNLN